MLKTVVHMNVQAFMTYVRGYHTRTWSIARNMIGRYLVANNITPNRRAGKEETITIHFLSLGAVFVITQFTKIGSVVDFQTVVFDVFRLEWMKANMYIQQKRQISRLLCQPPLFPNTPLNSTKFEIINSARVTPEKLFRIIAAITNSENKDVRNFYIRMSTPQLEFKNLELYLRALSILQTLHPINIWTSVHGYVKSMHQIIAPREIAYVNRTSDLYHLKGSNVHTVYLNNVLKVPRIVVSDSERHTVWEEQPDDGRYIQDYEAETFELNCPNAKLYIADVYNWETKKLMPIHQIKFQTELTNKFEQYVQVYSQDPEILESEKTRKLEAALQIATRWWDTSADKLRKAFGYQCAEEVLELVYQHRADLLIEEDKS